jgi:hypothetical protein
MLSQKYNSSAPIVVDAVGSNSTGVEPRYNSSAPIVVDTVGSNSTGVNIVLHL